VTLTARLFEHFKGYATTSAYQRHQRVMPVLYRMEQRGIPVDSRRMLSFAAVAQQGLIEAQETARELIGLGPVNLNSPASLLNALLEQDLVDPTKLPRTKTGKLSSAADSLTAAILNSELAEVLVEYKRLSKLTSGFLTPWQKQIAGDGRLHAQYRSIGATRTGRLSSAKPNMQQVPPVLREYLVPPKGKLWVSADYGQQELRILAELSKDRRLREIFTSGADLHQQVADDLRITRKAAKAINFGIVYGAGPRRISQELGIGYDRAYQIMDSYFERFYGVSTWLKEVGKAGDRGHVLQTLGLRKVQAEALFDPDYDGNRRYIGYKLPNMIIQGSGADMMLEAMINIDSIPGVELLTVVHDEANCAVDTPEQAEQIKEAMLDASLALMSTPMTVDAKVTQAWREG
jgi:DNA polymerase-1